jgi:hypothetical protein
MTTKLTPADVTPQMIADLRFEAEDHDDVDMVRHCDRAATSKSSMRVVVRALNDAAAND